MFCFSFDNVWWVVLLWLTTVAGDKSQVLDVDNPDHDTFPDFQRATRYECVLYPGDVLFIPGTYNQSDFS